MNATLFNSTALPGFERKTYAPSPVWRDSTAAPVKFVPLATDRSSSRRQAYRLFHKARKLERQTRTDHNKQDGKLGRNGLAVLHALLFDFLDHATGDLFPSYDTIARAANISVRSVARGLVKLKDAGVVSWMRRCRVEIGAGGRPELHQESNAYAVLKETSWHGYVEHAPPVPPPDPDSWGARPPMATGLDAAIEAMQAGASAQGESFARLAESDPDDALGAALARLSRRLF